MFLKIRPWLLRMAIVVKGLHDLAMVIIQVVRSVNVCIAFPILIVLFSCHCHPLIPLVMVSPLPSLAGPQKLLLVKVEITSKGCFRTQLIA